MFHFLTDEAPQFLQKLTFQSVLTHATILLYRFVGVPRPVKWSCSTAQSKEYRC